MMLSLLMVLPALATSGADTAGTQISSPKTTCYGLYIEATAPSFNQTDVPANAPILVQIGDGTCVNAKETVQVDLIGAETVALGVYSAADVAAVGGLLRFQPPEPMEPLRTYTLRVDLSYSGVTEIQFTVGSNDMRPISGNIEWDTLRTFAFCDLEIGVYWFLDPAIDPDGFSNVEVRYRGEMLDSALPAYPSGYFTMEIEPEQAEVCMEGVQVGASGEEVSAGELCSPIEAAICDSAPYDSSNQDSASPPCCKQTACGCSSGAAPPAWAWLLPLAGLVHTNRKYQRTIQ